MCHLSGLRGGARSEIIFLHESDIEASCGGVEGASGARGAAADDEDVELVGLREPVHEVLARGQVDVGDVHRRDELDVVRGDFRAVSVVVDTVERQRGGSRGHQRSAPSTVSLQDGSEHCEDLSRAAGLS